MRDRADKLLRYDPWSSCSRDGLIGYSGLLFSTVLRGQFGVYLAFLIALIGTLFSAYLTYLELFVIHAICQWCVASAVIMVAALICATLAAWHLTENER